MWNILIIICYIILLISVIVLIQTSSKSTSIKAIIAFSLGTVCMIYGIEELKKEKEINLISNIETKIGDNDIKIISKENDYYLVESSEKIYEVRIKDDEELLIIEKGNIIK